MANLLQTSSGLDVLGGTSGTISMTGVASGSLLYVVVADADANTVTFTVSDDLGNDWQRAVGQSGSGAGRSEIWYCLNAIAGDPTITVTASSSTVFVARAQEWDADGGTFTLATTSSINETVATTSHVCSANSSVIDTSGAAVVVCAAGRDGTSVLGTRAPGSGYTDFNGPTGTTDYDRAHWQYQDFSGAVTNERGAYTADVSRTTVGCIAAFEYSGGGGSGGCWWPCCSSPGSPGICTVRKLNSAGALQWTYLGHLTRSGVSDGSGFMAVDTVNDAIIVASGHGISANGACLESVPYSGGPPNWTATGETGSFQLTPMCALPSEDRIFWSSYAYDLDGAILFALSRGPTAATPGIMWAWNGPDHVDMYNSSDGTLFAAAAGTSYGPNCTDVDSSGNLWSYYTDTLYVVDVTDGSQLATYTISTNIIYNYAFLRIGPSDTVHAFGPDGVSDVYIEKYNSSGVLQWSISFADGGGTLYPMEIDSSGNIYVGNGTELRKYNSSGTFQWSYDHGALINGITIDESDNVYIAGDQAVV